MWNMKTSRFTLPLYEKDREAMKTIREYYGLASDADAVRMALHELARQLKGEARTLPKKEDSSS
jgi:hypothetical protein